MYSYLSHLQCPRCGTERPADRVQGLCECGSPLLARYDLAALRGHLTPADIAVRPPDLWRFHEMLPVTDAEHVVTLGEGMTPLLPLPRLGAEIDVPHLLMKDEGTIPGGSFKSRGAAVGVSRARELGVTGIAMPTNGNAGAAWAQYAARAGMSALIAMPEAAPAICRGEVAATGAELYLVSGHIGDCGRLINSAVGRRPGTMEVSTLKEPYRLEGKKTMGLEIAEQLAWQLPDVIVYPTGGGVGIIGIYKALTEMAELGWITGTLPRLVAVQAAGCAPIVRAFDAGAPDSQAWPGPSTVAFGINVPKALGDFLVLDAIYRTGGTAIAVDDDRILAMQRRVATTEGAVICPEGAATIAAIGDLRARGWIGAEESVVALNTGAGIKYPETLRCDAPLLSPSGEIPTAPAVRDTARPPADPVRR